MKILRLTDSVEIKHNEITVTIKPINREQKAQISSCVKMSGGKEIADYEMIGIKTIQFSVKELKGVKDYHGKNYELEFDGEILTEQCAIELLGAFASTPITTALSSAIAQDLSPIDGIEFRVKQSKK